MRFFFLAVLAVALLSGCLGKPAATEGGTSAKPATMEDTRALGWLNNSAVAYAGVSSDSFTVHVPAGGAKDVLWDLRVTGGVIDATVQGPGCQSNGVVLVGSSSSASGTCGDLAEGTYDFHVKTTGPWVQYSAVVKGLVAVPFDSRAVPF